MSLSEGTSLGPYTVVAPLGAGGMGEVYRATDSRLKRQVAVKILPSGVAADPERLARFQREMERPITTLDIVLNWGEELRRVPAK